MVEASSLLGEWDILAVPRSRLERKRSAIYKNASVEPSLYNRIYLDSIKIITADFTVLYILEESQTPVITAFVLQALSVYIMLYF